ncbi:MAG: MOSC domain-containing protein [Actinocatenispora sp.]
MSGTVLSITRYPVKSARGEALNAVGVEADGLHADRTWACVDASDGTVVSVKHPGRWGRLLQVTATVRPDGAVLVTASGEVFEAGSAAADAALSTHLGRPVRLTSTVPDSARLHRLLPDEAGLVPDWLGDARPGQELVTGIAARPGGRFVDFGPVHLLTTGALTRLAGRLGRAEQPASPFRPNLVVDVPADPGIGDELHIGDVVLRVLLPTPRCVVPGLNRSGDVADRDLLRTLAGRYRTLLPGYGRAATFGTYAEVLRAGRIEVGMTVDLRRATLPAAKPAGAAESAEPARSG